MFAEKYNAARAMENKYRDAPRAGWIEKGSRARSNQAITLPRTEAMKLAADLASATYANFFRLYEVLNLQGYMSRLAEGEPGAVICERCHNNYLLGWMGGKCPYCEAEEAASRKVKEILGGGEE
uniref:Uncharacterized protein n=1 Tax=Dulem virus 34 TaxID=3145752 RepID=A0AAU8B7A5_9CAUD